MSSSDGIVHWDDVETRELAEGDIGGDWRLLGEAAGTVGVGLRRFELEAGRRSTALHVHGAEEEVFFVLGGSGLLWQGRHAHEVRAGDCIVHLPRTEPHCLVAGDDGLDALVFGTRVATEACWLPRALRVHVGPTTVETEGPQNLWAKDAAEGRPELPAVAERPANVVALEDVAARRMDRGRTHAEARRLGAAAGSRGTGLNHVVIDPDGEGAPPHCHGAEEELFVVLGGEGAVVLGEAEHAVRRGHVVARPPATRVAHSFRAGAEPLELLAYGTKEPNDIVYYPRSNKVFFRGVGLIGRFEPLGYWDGEE